MTSSEQRSAKQPSHTSPFFVGWGLIILGGYLVLHNFLSPILETTFLQLGISPRMLDHISQKLPLALVSGLMIIWGVRMLRNKNT